MKNKLNIIYNLGEKEGMKVRWAQSTDEGKTWQQKDLDFGLGEGFVTACFDAEVIGKDIYLSFLGASLENEEGPVFYYGSKSSDNGKTWTKPARIGQTRLGDICLHYDFKSVGSQLFLTYTKMGRSDLYPKEVCLFTSKDKGKTWQDNGYKE